MSDFMTQCCETYKELLGDPNLKFKPVDTPFPPSERDRDPNIPHWKQREESTIRPEELDDGKPGVLASSAAKILMKILYGARIARWDLLRVVSLLATKISCWTAACDRWLYRLMCYIDHTKGITLSGYVGNTIDELNIGLWSDADWAGDRSDDKWRSTNGAFAAMLGSHTDFPIWAKSKKQDSTSCSTPEAELVAAHYATRNIASPLLDLLESVKSSELSTVTLYEDNQAAISIIESGKNPNMKHITRSHGISISYLHEFWSQDYASYCYEKSADQRADIFTKAFRTAGTWQSACKLIGLDYGGSELAIANLQLARKLASATIVHRTSQRRTRANRPKWRYKR